MTRLADVPTPAVVLDLDILERNLARMATRARELGVALRPHAKTHKCVEVARLQQAHGIAGLTVSTLVEARVFANHSFSDITWAFPVILSRIAEARELAQRVTLRLVVDSVEAVDALERGGTPFHVWLKVDCGYHRAGVDPHAGESLTLARRLAESDRLQFDGILTHSGHAYHGRDPAAIRKIAEQERSVMVEFGERLRRAGIAVPAISVGSTPAMSQVTSLAGVTEARPGNYALYDYSQIVLGSCRLADNASTVLASVVSTHPGTGHAVIDAGALALSKDPGSEFAPRQSMGEILADGAGGLRDDCRVVSVSQEHGIISAPLPVGTRLRIVPNHSCLTVAQFDEFVVVRGDDVVDRWRIWRGR